MLPPKVNSHQYADDTTIYKHCKPTEIENGKLEIQSALDRLSSWSSQYHLALNPKKTKAMLFSTSQMSRVHGLDAVSLGSSVDGKQIEQVSTFPLLGTRVHQNLKWNNEINSKISTCYRTLAVVRKLKHLAPFAVRKQLSECLIISKIYYNDILSHPIPDYLLKRLQRVQLAAASFVLGRYAKMLDLATLRWLPIVECRKSHLLLAAYKAMYFTNWPSYLKLDVYTPGRSLRSSTETTLKVPKTPGTFQDSTSKSFNNLPPIIRNCTSLTEFKSLLLKHLKEKAVNRLSL